MKKPKKGPDPWAGKVWTKEGAEINAAQLHDLLIYVTTFATVLLHRAMQRIRYCAYYGASTVGYVIVLPYE